MSASLVDGLRLSLERRRPWFDGLQGPLAERRWTLLGRECGIDGPSYRTARVRRCDATAEAGLAGHVRLPDGGTGGREVVVEVLSPGSDRRYLVLGLDLAGADQAGSPSCLDRLDRALRLLASDPTAAALLDAVLWAVHVIRPASAEYDVSYSDPDVPFSIFVGVPDVDVPHGDLRLAEGILHECLHLQLSLVEDVMPLVTQGEETHFSPWQATMRPAQGVLHGTYVFALVGDFLRRLMVTENHPGEATYLADRVATCADEVTAAARSLLAGGTLTARGRELVGVLTTF